MVGNGWLKVTGANAFWTDLCPVLSHMYAFCFAPDVFGMTYLVTTYCNA